ncbi:MAG: hypothetical protein ACI8PB_001131 [Desulforhopalus sp.]|jgi:hypothetical protein
MARLISKKMAWPLPQLMEQKGIQVGAIPDFTSVLFRYDRTDIIALSNCFHTKEFMGSIAEAFLQKRKSDIIDKQPHLNINDSQTLTLF